MFTAGLMLAVSVGLAGCVSQEESRGVGQPILPSRGGVTRASAPRVDEAALAQARRDGVAAAVSTGDNTVSTIDIDGERVAEMRPVKSTAVQVGVASLGRVRTDGRTLPIVSPNGEFIATSSGIDAGWDSVLAVRDTRVPTGTRIEIGRLAIDTSPSRTAAVLDPMLLGRNADDLGFLAERPGGGDARSIERVLWETGDIETLVPAKPGETNAFAAMGPGGWLAWSRRAADSDTFSLVVRGPDGVEHTLDGGAGHWLMPTFAGYGNDLYVLRLEGDVLWLYHTRAGSSRSLADWTDRIKLATSGASIGTAYQVLAAVQPPDRDLEVLGASGTPPLYFYHPSRFGAASWKPGESAPKFYVRGSFAGFPDVTDDRMCLITGQKHLRRRPRSTDHQVAEAHVIRGVILLRVTSNPAWPYVAMESDGERVALTAMQLIPPPAGEAKSAANR